MDHPGPTTDLGDGPSAGGRERYQAFISYSHSTDGHLAPAFHDSVEQFGRKWYRRRAVRVFRDDANMGATPHLWGAIETALASSEWFVLMASPDAARSPWVYRELEWWLTHRSEARLIVVVTAGSVGWDPVTGRVDEELTDALPPSFAARRLAEPRWIDLRTVRTADATDPAYHAAVVDVAAALQGLPKDTLIGEQVRQQRGRRRWIGAAAVTLLLLTLVSTTAGVIAVAQRNRAEDQARVATSRLLLPQARSLISTDPRLAIQLAQSAFSIHPDPETRATLTELVTGTQYSGALPHAEGKENLADRGDGVVAASGVGGTTALWDVNNPARPLPLGATRSSDGQPVVAVAFSADARTMFTATSRGVIEVWDVAEPRAPSRAGRPIATDGKLTSMVAGSGVLVWSGSDGRVTLLDVSIPERPRIVGSTPVIEAEGVFSLALNAKRSILAVRGESAVSLWDVGGHRPPTLSVALPNAAPGSSLDAIAFDPTGTVLAVADSDVVLWNVSDLAAPRVTSTIDSGRGSQISETLVVAFAQRSPVLATGSVDRSVVLWDIADPTNPVRVDLDFGGHSSALHSMLFLPGDGTLMTSEEEPRVILWDTAGKRQPRPHRPVTSTWGSQTSAVALSTDHRVAATGGRQGAVTLWDVPSATDARPLGLVPVTGSVTSLDISADRRLLAVGVAEGGAVVVDIADPRAPRPAAALTTEQTGAVQGVAFAPGGRTVATGATDGSVRLWDLSHPTAPTSVGVPLTDPRLSSFVDTLAFSRDGSVLAAGGGRGVALWDVHDLARPQRVGPPLAEQRDTVGVVAFSPASDLLVTGSADGTAILWDVADPERPNPVGRPIAPDIVSVHSAGFSGDGTMLVLGGIYNQVTLWDTTVPQQPLKIGATLAADRLTGWAAALSSDGSLLVTSDIDGGAIFWDLRNLGQLRTQPLAASCMVTSGALTPEQWQRYVPTVDYQDACTA